MFLLCSGNPRVVKDGYASGYAPEVNLCTDPVASDAYLSFRATIFSLFGGGFNSRIHRQHETRQVKHVNDIIQFTWSHYMIKYVIDFDGWG